MRGLLQEADRLAGAVPSGPADLAQRVRRSARRRRLVKGVSAAVLTLLVSATVAFLLRRERRPEETIEVAKRQAEIQILQKEIDQARETVNHLLLLEQARLLRRELAVRPDPLEELDRQTDRTAFILVRHANQLEHRIGRADLALTEYRRVVNMFPKTTWANIARDRIRQLENRKET